MEDLIKQGITFVLGLIHISPTMATAIFAMLFAVSEFLGGFSAIKSNAIYQLIANVIKGLAGKADPKL